MSQVLQRLGLRAAGGNHSSIRAWIERLELSTAHFVRSPDRRPRTARPLDEILVEHSSYARAALKRRLYREGIKERRCELCGQGETWNGRRMSLILDHINGVHDDNRLENLQIVCPNCAATLDTHCGRNNARPREPRACARCGEVFDPRSPKQRYCSRECGQRYERAGRARPGARRVERPAYEQLIAEVKELGFSATGRKYGVSDNAIRKWIIGMERERARADDGDAPTIAA